MCVICVLFLIVVPLPPGKFPFAVKIIIIIIINLVERIIQSVNEELLEKVMSCCEKLLAEDGDRSGIQRKGNVCS
jgi:hypothetical protein